MFDIGFFELLIIGVVSLVVIGPERLPETARAVGLWLGRLKRSLRETRSELEKQLGADDIRRQLHNEEVMRSLESTRRQIQDAVQEGAIDHPLRKYRDEEERPDPAHGDSASSAPQSDTPRSDSAQPASEDEDKSAPRTPHPAPEPHSDAEPKPDTDSKPSS